MNRLFFFTGFGVVVGLLLALFAHSSTTEVYLVCREPVHMPTECNSLRIERLSFAMTGMVMGGLGFGAMALRVGDDDEKI